MRLAADWLAQPALQRVIHAIAAAGSEARLVGGCVRDGVQGVMPHDIDLCTPLLPEAVTAACEAAGCKVIPTGLKHGTVTVISHGQGFEVTTLRRDVQTDGRHAVVAFTESWQEDAARRDFTINALSCSATGEVFDYFGGLADLAAGRVRFVGRASQRIREDVLRILRFFRFQARYGQGPADAEALEACRELMPLLSGLSAERVRDELLKILIGPQAAGIWQMMADLGVFTVLDVPLLNVAGLEPVVRAEAAFALAPQALRRLRAVLSGPDAAGVARRLRLSGAQASRLTALMPLPVLPEDKAACLRLAYRLGADVLIDALVLGEMRTTSAATLALLAEWQRPRFPLCGADLAELGVAPGPQMGEILRKVEQWWLESDFIPTQAKCLQKARDLLTA